VAQGGLPVQAKVVEMLGASQQINTLAGAELLRISTAAQPTVLPAQPLQVRAKPGAERWYDHNKKRVA
jgi:hypothetical protein